MNTEEKKAFKVQFWRFLWASILIGLSACLGNVVDAMIVGNLIDEDSVSASVGADDGKSRSSHAITSADGLYREQ